MADKKNDQAQPESQPAVVQPERKLDEAPAGGCYMVNGQLVDANGQPVKG